MRDLLEEIKIEFNKVHKSEERKRSGWTKAFIDSLVNLGYKNHYVYTSLASNLYRERVTGGEWLVDLCWSKDKCTWNKQNKGLNLICECEWSNDSDEILYDFLKLAVIRADYKIMIIQFYAENDFMRIVDKCRDSFDNSVLNDGARFLIAGSGNGPKEEEKMRFAEF